MLDAAGRLGKIIVGMNKALGDIPITVKLRTGVKDGRNTAHKLMPRLGQEWGTAGITVRHIQLFALLYMCLITSRRSCMAGQGNNATRSSRTGTTSSSASTRSAHTRPKRIVRDYVLFPLPMFSPVFRSTLGERSASGTHLRRG